MNAVQKLGQLIKQHTDNQLNVTIPAAATAVENKGNAVMSAMHSLTASLDTDYASAVTHAEFSSSAAITDFSSSVAGTIATMKDNTAGVIDSLGEIKRELDQDRNEILSDATDAEDAVFSATASFKDDFGFGEAFEIALNDAYVVRDTEVSSSYNAL